jgi:hypothetical protein
MFRLFHEAIFRLSHVILLIIGTPTEMAHLRM